MSNLSTIVSFLESKGLSGVAIAGIIGNLEVESSFNPNASNPGEGAIGIAQWEGGRRTELQQWARAHGGSETDLNMQLGFMWHELTTSYHGVLTQLQNVRSAREAAHIWDVGVGGVNSGTGYENSSGSADLTREQDAVTFHTTGNMQVGPYLGGGGDSAPSGQAGSPLRGGNTPVDYKAIDSLGGLLSSVPELRKILNEAQAGSWTLDKFQNAVEDSHWYKTHSDTARSFLIQQANDPASASQQLRNTQNSIMLLARQLGFSVNAQQVQNIATSAILSGNDSNQQWLAQQLGRREDYSHITSLGGLQGGMANTAQQLQSLAADYGFTWSPSQIAQRAQGILTGQTTIDTYKQRLMSWAASAFPGLREQIMSGATVKDLADPYVQSMSNLLEVDPQSLNVYTPMIRQALQGTVPAGAKQGAEPTATPLWKFEQQVRSDPRWAFTDNAKATMSSALLQIGNVFGFGPSSSG